MIRFHLPMIFFVISAASMAHAAIVTAFRSPRVILTLSDHEDALVHDTVEISDSSGNLIASGKIVRRKGSQIAVQLEKGEVSVGTKVRLRRISSRWKYGVSIGASAVQQSVRLTNQTRVPLAGTTPLIRLSASERFRSSWEWEIGLTFEYFLTRGSVASDACGGSSFCRIETLNMTPFARVGWLPFGDSFWNTQLRTGIDAALPAAPDSNIVEMASFQPIVTVVGGWAGRIPLEENAIILTLEAGWHPGTSDSSLFRIAGLVGYSW